LLCKNLCEKLDGILDKDGQCHAYDIIDRICLSLEIMKSEDRKSEVLSLAGGCYDGNHVAHYTRAKPGVQYKFDFVPVEVRSEHDPYIVWAEEGYQIKEDGSKLQLISYVLVIAGFFFGLITCVSY